MSGLAQQMPFSGQFLCKSGTGIPLREVRAQVGASVATDAKDMSELQKPILEYPATAGDQQGRQEVIPHLELDSLLLGDSAKILKKLPSQSINLVVTSPPYADNRKGPYQGWPIDKYVDHFLPITKELKRVLTPDGSFVLNIKERAMEGERQTYVLELILALKKQGWLWTEEYVWCKSNCYPGKWPNRFRDSWERCLHFTLNKGFKMRQNSVMVPVGDWAKSRLKNLSETDKTRDESKVGSGFGKNISNWIGREMVYPSNVLHLATECGNKEHSATFPVALPEWFIKLLTDEGDVILDPFMGSGTSAIAAMNLNRHYVGVELSPEYHHVSEDAVLQAKAKRQHRNGHRHAGEGNRGQPGEVPQAAPTRRPKTSSVAAIRAQEPVPV